MQLEYKTCGASYKTDSAQEGIIEAIVAVFNNVDSGNEVIRPGAFTESLAQKPPKGVWSHNWTEDVPIAKTLEARELLPGDRALPAELVDLGGLYVKGQFNLEIQKARDVYSSFKFGTLDEFSIGYKVREDRFDKKDNLRELLKLKLFEWSPVLVGMNDSTSLISVKGEFDAPARRLADHSEAVLATCKEYADRIKSLRDLRAKEGRVISAATRGRMQTCMDGMQMVMNDLQDLMMMADPPAKADQDIARRLHAEILHSLSTA